MKIKNVFVESSQPDSDEKVLKWKVKVDENGNFLVFCNGKIVLQCYDTFECDIWKCDLEAQGLEVEIQG